VVIHSIKDDAIAYIANSYSGRRVGDASLLGLKKNDLEGFHKERDIVGPYENAGNNGQRIRSMSAVLKNSRKKAIGIMCINLDFSAMEAGLDVLEAFLRPANIDAPPQALFRNDWRESIKLEIRAYLLAHNKRMDALDAKSRKNIIRLLDEKGLFYARKSIEQLAALLCVSRATAYKDLNLIRKEKKNTASCGE